jgi:polyisoprenoid-binding protein YceI
MRDKDLRSDHFLDVEKYPTITFKSKKVETPAAGKLKITGDLTVHGVTKEVVLDVDGPSQPAKDGKGNLHMGASAETTIDRTEFGMTGGRATVGTDIAIIIDTELVKAAAPTK